MSTDRQREANQQNATHSTGPRSRDGKERASANALKHGLTGKRIVLPGEDSGEFEAFRSALVENLAPVGALEEIFADKIVVDAWRLRRIPVLEAALQVAEQEEMKSLEIGKPSHELRATRTLVRNEKAFGNLERYETTRFRSLIKALHELQRLQAARAGQPITAPIVVDHDVTIHDDSKQSVSPGGGNH